MSDKTIPQTPEAEAAVIGSLLIDGESIHAISNEIKPEYFYNDDNRYIYKACLTLSQRGEAIDQITIAKELSADGKLNEKTIAYMSHLIVDTPTSSHAEHYARIVKASAIQRMAISMSSYISDVAHNINDPVELISDIGKSYLDLQSSISVPQLVTPKQWATYGVERYATLNEGRTVSISTGIEQLDIATGGVFPGEYWILAGPPGIGKTQIAIQLAEVLSLFGNILFCSIEMSKADILDRRIATLTQQQLRRIRTGKYSNDLYDDIIRNLGLIAETNIYYFGQSDSLDVGGGLTTDSIYTMANHMKLAYGLKVIIIDYLQNIADTYGKSLYERATHISRKLQNMARSLNIPVICLCQLNRELFRREDKHPRMSDLRDSGGIEQDADLIVFLHRDNLFMSDEQLRENGIAPDSAELLIAKQRQGDMSNIRIPLKWDGNTKRYNGVN